MKKINILKKEQDFTKIINKIKPYRSKSYTVFLENNTLDTFKFGISVPKKTGNAVVRNRIKRQVKSIIDKKDYQKNFDCIIIIKKVFLENKYEENEKELLKIFKDLNILKGE